MVTVAECPHGESSAPSVCWYVSLHLERQILVIIHSSSLVGHWSHDNCLFLCWFVFTYFSSSVFLVFFLSFLFLFLPTPMVRISCICAQSTALTVFIFGSRWSHTQNIMTCAMQHDDMTTVSSRQTLARWLGQQSRGNRTSDQC